MKRRGLGAISLCAATLIAYLPVWSAGFIWNDSDYVTRPALRSWHGLRLIWTQVGATEQYYPLLHSFFWLQHRLWSNAALGYHLTNVLLHAFSAFLFWRLLEGWWRERPGAAWFAALLFAVHPVMSESVAWISEQKNTLSLVFYLLAGLSYWRFWLGRRKLDYGIAFAWFGCALLSKSVTATLPAALLVIIWWQNRKIRMKEDMAPLLPWFAVAAAWGLFSAWVEKTFVGAHGADFALSGLQRVLLAARIPWFYLAKLVWPAHLVFIYPRWSISANDPVAWGYLAATAAVFGILAERVLRTRWLVPRVGPARAENALRLGGTACILFFVGSLFPTLGFFNVYAFIYSYVADHWDYLPALGVFAGAAYLLSILSRAWPSAVRSAAAALLLAILAVRTFQEARGYQDAGRFYATIIARNPDAWMAQHNLGDLLAERGQDQAALPFYSAALRARSDLPLTEYNYGLALGRLGRAAEAEERYRKALALQPGFAAARATLSEVDNNAGVAALQSGQLSAAAKHLGEALKFNPRSAVAWANLGRVYAAAQRPGAALAPLEEALKLQPNFPEAENDLGAIFATLGRPAEAIPHYEAALRLQPNFPAAEHNLQLARSSLP